MNAETRYRIVWKHKTTGERGYGFPLYSAGEREHARRFARVLDEDHPDYEHEIEAVEVERDNG